MVCESNADWKHELCSISLLLQLDEYRTLFSEDNIL
jgi:hypothetical protein